MNTSSPPPPTTPPHRRRSTPPRSCAGRILASAAELATRPRRASQPADRRRQRALDRWFAGFAAQVRRHHELHRHDGRAGARRPRRARRAGARHAGRRPPWIDELLSDLGDALGVLSFGLGAEAFWIGKASRPRRRAAPRAGRQLAREERLLTPLVARCFDADEREVVHDETMRAVATGPVRFSLAWLYAHVTDDERAAVVAARPGGEPPGLAHPPQRLRTLDVAALG